MSATALRNSRRRVFRPWAVVPFGRPRPRGTCGSLTFSMNMFTNNNSRYWKRQRGGQLKIVIPGGSGHIGTLLSRALTTEGHEVVVLSRMPKSAPWRVAHWDGVTVGDWTRELDGADVVINVAGRSVNCRYNSANRSAILESRVRSTQAIGAAISRSPRPPRIWLQMSTATIYAHRFDAPNDERSGVIGGAEAGAPSTWRFSIDVACAWEAAAAAAVAPSTRQVLMRSAMVMSPEPGGVYEALHGVVRLGLGGRVGDGRQFVSWIHEQDFIAAVRWL